MATSVAVSARTPPNGTVNMAPSSMQKPREGVPYEWHLQLQMPLSIALARAPRGGALVTHSRSWPRA